MAGYRGQGGAALVTGASGGIGREVAKLLAARGMDVILAARSREPLESLAAILAREHGVRAVPWVVDLSAEDAARSLPGSFAALEVTVDLLVNNAGFGVYGPFGNQGLEREAAMIRLNTVAPAILAGVLLPGMIRRGHGRILNVASTAGFAPVPWLATYAATKAHLIAWTHALDVELKGTGVRVAVACPGTVSTGFLETAGADRRARPLPSSSVEEVARGILAGLDTGRRVFVIGWLNRLHRAAAAVSPPAMAAAIGGAVNRPRDPEWRSG